MFIPFQPGFCPKSNYKDFEFGKDGGAVGSNDTATYAGVRSNFTIITLDINGVSGTANTPYALRVIDSTGAETTSAGDLLIGIDKLVFGYDFEAISTAGNRPHVFIDPTTLSAYTAENTVMNINDAPALTGVAGLLGIGNTNTPYTINISTLLQGYTDADVGDTFSVTGLTATNGSVALATDGINYVFTPTTGFNGIAKISYQVADNHGLATNASKNLTIASFIETVGNTSLVLFNSLYMAVDPLTNVLTNIKYAGVNASPTSRSGWTIIGAEKNAAGVVGAIWKNSSTGEYSYSTNTSNSVSIPDVTTYEASFRQDLNSDGYITTYGTAGSDTLGGLNADEKLIGGLGNDVYIVDSANDLVIELLNEGIDTVNSSATVALAANVENLNLTGTVAINGTGNALNNIITGNSSNNILNGGAGADSLSGGAGNDVLDGSGDTTSIDTFTGGSGDDVYGIYNSATVIVENAGAVEGNDTVWTAVNYTLSANIESMYLVGAITGTGNSGDNYIVGYGADAQTINGGAGNDTLNGGLGNDTLDGGIGIDLLIGGAGDDLYFIDDAGDVVVEIMNDGIDTINSSVTITALAANVENINLTGTAAINVTGNALNNNIVGNSSNNILNGGAGADSLSGGAGNDVLDGSGDTTSIDTFAGGSGDDVYGIYNSATVIVENAGAVEGNDTVWTAVNYTLSANIENMYLVGAITGTGSSGNNYIVGYGADAQTINGGAGNDTLDGGIGNDSLIGGAGDDLYFIDNAGDVVTEIANDGIDTINSSVAITALAANVENLTLTGTSVINGTGNALNNIITGNSAVNRLIGLAGNDTYYVTAGDLVVEAMGAGTDTVISSNTFTLAANVENLTLIGTAVINGTGNGLANIITGNSANNTLRGGAGTDTFVLLKTGGGLDTIADFTTGDRLNVRDFGIINTIFTVSSGAGRRTGIGSANNLFIFDSSSKTLYFDADGNGAGSSVQIASLAGSTVNSLTATNFII